ncbi:MAG: toprim domain-containing protein, partial [Xanthobacteraceae bacterium]
GAAPPDRGALREKSERARRESEQQAEEDRKRKRRRALELWSDGKKIEGSPVEDYLRARGIEFQKIEHWDDGLRFHPKLSSWQEPHSGPAMLGAFRHPAFGFGGLHATFLRADGKDKAGLWKNKLMLGSIKGAAIRLTCGASGLALGDAEARLCEEGRLGEFVPGDLAVGEGIETMLSAAAALPELRCWAAGSLGNIGAQDLSSAAIRGCLICADNDAGAKARAALEKGRVDLARFGKMLAVARAHAGGDLNDLAKMGATG